VLVLTRRANQSIMIGHEVVVTVLEVRGDQVRLGIDAPRAVSVHREEVYRALQERDGEQGGEQGEAVVDLTGPIAQPHEVAPPGSE